MKIRMNEKSVRLRLLKSEVEQFRQTGRVDAAIRFSEERALYYRLMRADVAEPEVRFNADALEVLVPLARATQWSEGPDVGIYGNTGSVDVLVEKDFRRTSAPSPDDHDRYPNPRSARV
jgi:hypothetical protein